MSEATLRQLRKFIDGMLGQGAAEGFNARMPHLSALLDAEVTDLDLVKPDELRRFITARAAELRGASQPTPNPLEWIKFYREVFGIELDFTGVHIPAARPGFNWPIVVVEGMTANRAYDECAKRFPSWRSTKDLDEAVAGRNDRDPNATYVVLVRDRIEADQELKNKSAEDLRRAKIAGVTLLERILLELWYFWKTGNHLDVQNVTLCSGSRDADGDVPCTRWHGEFRIGSVWCDPAYRTRDLRSRPVVSAG
ncbi:MAG: hypothetical protein Q8R35_01225 [bacterium]|nr:hypothetical protein [bacterium]